MGKLYCVYVHTAPNGKKYVGATCCKPVNRRWQNGYGYTKNIPFFDDIKAFGWDNIKHEIIADNLSAYDASKLEHEYVDLFNTTDPLHGYNLAPGGKSGYHLLPEHREKIGKANAGENNGMYGHIYTEEEKKRIGLYSLGRRHSEESRKKIRDAMIKRRESGWKPPTGKEHHGSRAVLQFSVDGRFIARYDTAVMAHEATGAQRSGICNCAKGNPRHKTAGGYVWRYADAE